MSSGRKQLQKSGEGGRGRRGRRRGGGGGGGGRGDHRGAFTDTEISGGGRSAQEDRLMKERDERLVRWGDGGAGGDGGGDWDENEHEAWDQFKVNEDKFGVTTSYDENLYTTPLDKSTQFYKDNAAHASRLAAEMQGKKTDNIHVAQERGQAMEEDMDEESMFSGVLSSSPSSYVPPHRRSSTPPPPTSTTAPTPLVVITTDKPEQAQESAVKPARKPLRKPLSMGKFNPNATAFKPKFNFGSALAAAPTSPPPSNSGPIVVPPPLISQSKPVDALYASIGPLLAGEDPRSVPVTWHGNPYGGGGFQKPAVSFMSAAAPFVPQQRT